jgi:hypothetical protein
MTHAGKAGSCLVALIFSTMFMHDVFAGSLVNEGPMGRARENSLIGHDHHETDDPVVQASAGPRTPAVRIVQVRPHISQGANPGTVFIETDQASLCNTSVYSIDMGNGGSKEAYAAALAAFIVDKPVVLELVNTGCTGAGTKIQSIFLNR